MTAEENNPKVVYDIGDLLDRMGTRIDSGFSRLETKLDGKADKSDISRIDGRLDEHGKKIGHLEDWRRTTEAAENAVRQAAGSRMSLSQWRFTAAAGAAGALAGWAVLLYYLVH